MAGAAAILSVRPIYEPDLWWHLAQGREDAAGRLVRTNVFSFTYPDYRQHFTPWLFDLAAYGAWQAAGAAGIQLLQFALLLVSFLLVDAACRTRAPAWAAVPVMALAFFIIEPRALPRPHLASFAGMAACTLLIERSAVRRSAAPLVWVIPLIALWSNLHVECVFGVLAAGLYAVGEIARPAALTRTQAIRALAIAAAAAVATLANPYGWGLALYFYENLAVPQVLAIAELRPPYLPDYRAFFAYVLLLAVVLLLSWRTVRAWEALLAVTFAVFGAMYLRVTPLVALVTAPMLAGRLSAASARGIDRRAIVVTGVVLALACSRIPLRLLVTEIVPGSRAVVPQRFFSAAAIAFVERAQLQGPVFNSQNLGGYLAWELFPRVQVFQDSRLQAYPPGHFGSIIAASQAQGDWDVLVRDVDWAIVSVPRPNQLSGHARFPATAWASVYQDDAIEIVVRRAGRYARLAAGR